MSFFYTHTPTFPVVDPDPTVAKAVKNFHIKEWVIIGVGGFTGYGFGWMSARKPLRVGNARANCAIGLFGASIFSLTNSLQRLMGLEANEHEVAKYGALVPAQLERAREQSMVRNRALIDRTNPLDDPETTAPLVRYGELTAEEVVEYRKRAKKIPHVYGEEEKK